MLAVYLMETPVTAQQAYSNPYDMEVALREAERLMIAQQGDRAVRITEPLMKQLKSEGRYDTHFGFRVRMVHGLALFHSTEEVTSFGFLWNLKDESRKNKEWAVLANVCREIAKIQEINQQAEEAYASLQEAKQLIQNHQIDSIYAAFAIRMASWHRVFGNKDSAYFYVERAIHKAQDFNQIFEEAEGYLLLSLLERKEKTALPYALKAVELYQKINVYTSSTTMHINIANMYAVNKDYENAFKHIDTAIFYTEKYLENDDFYHQHNYYFKAFVYREIGLMDSVLVYLAKSHEAELRLLESNKQQQIIEINKKYDFDKKNQELNIEKTKNQWLFLGIGLFFIFGAILAYYYIRLRRANALTRKQAEELHALDKTKTRFFANVSHELRTPLTLITGAVKTLMKENQLTQRQVRLLKIARQGSANLESLVNEILDLSKMEAGKMELLPEATAIAAFFEHYLQQYESLLESNEVHYQYLIKIRKDYMGLIDREKTRQVLFNLLSNAFKFTPPQGKVNVTVFIKKDRMHLQVSDTGKGIHPDDLPHVFERYFQTQQQDSAATGGTGIGLAICNEYAKLFGGKIEVSSHLGVGTTFDVEFPCEKVDDTFPLHASLIDGFSPCEEDLGSDIHETLSPIQQKDERPTLLLVEDNRELQKYMRMILEQDYQVMTASNGQKALELLQESANQVDLIISDLMMPVMDGYQLLEKLKSSTATRQIPTIMLTARAGKEDRLQVLRIGVDSYLTKPFDEEELHIHIKNLLNNQAVRKEALEETENEAKLLMRHTEKDEKQGGQYFTGSDFYASDSFSEEKMRNIEAFVRENLANPSLSVSVLEDQFAMSESTLLRFLKQNTGLSTKKYISEIRLTEARSMLEEGKYDSVTRIAYETGYTDVRTFSRSFKNRFGKLPTEVIC